MEMQGKYVDTKSYFRVMKKYGFKYSPMTRTFVLSYPFVPKSFQKDAVEVQVRDLDAGLLTEIESVDYYQNSSGYKKTDKPEKKFREYVEEILKEGIEQSHPKYLPA